VPTKKGSHNSHLSSNLTLWCVSATARDIGHA